MTASDLSKEPAPSGDRVNATTYADLGDLPFSVDHLDRTADPTVDFYQFATGSWIRRHPIPADKVIWGAFSELTERNFERMHRLLEEAAAASRRRAPAVRPVVRQVGTLYASAIDTARRNARGFAPIAAAIARLERLPRLSSLVPFLARLHAAGIEPIFHTAVDPDERHSSTYAFYAVQGGLSLPDRDYYFDDRFAEIRRAYVEHIARMERLLGESEATAAAHAKTVLAIETELARTSRSRTELRDPNKNYNAFTLDELGDHYPTLRFPRYWAYRGLPSASHVVIGQPEFFGATDALLRRVSLAGWKVYLRWQIVHANAPFLHEAVEAENFRFFHRTLLGQPEPEPAWKRAALVVDRVLGEALGELYVERYFPPEARAKMAELVDDLRAVFRDRLRSLDWMSEATRAKALEKFDRFTVKIGHPDKFRDYSSVRLARGDYAGNVRRAVALEVARQASRVGQPVDRSEWYMTPPQVNAYFNPTMNEIVFPAGILQPPFFDATKDPAVNYGGIGVVIGHEITHGYDDQGRKYDADGNLNDWWTDADAQEFTRRAKKAVEQYARYEPLPGQPVNGELTLGENLADLGGVRIAYDALLRRLERSPELRRPIDGFTAEQRFFLSFAQIWRSSVRPEEATRRLTIDPHAPPRFRVIGPLSNVEAFYAAFQVPPTSPLWRAEADRVQIW